MDSRAKTATCVAFPTVARLSGRANERYGLLLVDSAIAGEGASTLLLLAMPDGGDRGSPRDFDSWPTVSDGETERGLSGLCQAFPSVRRLGRYGVCKSRPCERGHCMNNG